MSIDSQNNRAGSFAKQGPRGFSARDIAEQLGLIPPGSSNEYFIGWLASFSTDAGAEAIAALNEALAAAQAAFTLVEQDATTALTNLKNQTLAAIPTQADAAVTAAISAHFDDLRGPPGPPGTDTGQIGLFKDIGSITVPGATTRIRTTGYHSDGVGAGPYRKVASGPATSYRKQSADGAWWELAEEAIVTVFQFGAKGDGVTDDWQALQDSTSWKRLNTIRSEYSSAPCEVVVPSVNTHYLSTKTWIIDNNVKIRGTSPSNRSLGAACIKFATGAKMGDDFTYSCGMFIKGPAGSTAGGEGSPYDVAVAGTYSPDNWGAGRPDIRNLRLEPVAKGGADFCLIFNLPCTLEDIAARYARFANFYAVGNTSGSLDAANTVFGTTGSAGVGVGGGLGFRGNTDGALITRCTAMLSTEGHGFAASGNDSQIMTFLNCDASQNAGCGFRDNSSIGNHYAFCHTASNTSKTLASPASGLLQTNGDFASDTVWVKGPGWTITGGQAVSDGTNGDLSQPIVLAPSTSYVVEFEATERVAGALALKLSGAGADIVSTKAFRFGADGRVERADLTVNATTKDINQTARYAWIVTTNASGATTLSFTNALGFVGSIDNVKVYPTQHYVSVLHHTAAADNHPSTGANKDKYWTTVVATIPDHLWTVGQTYIDTGGINIANASGGNYPTIVGHYTEGGSEIGEVPRGNTSVFGGLAAGTGRVYMGPDSNNTQYFAGPLTATPSQWKQTIDSSGYQWGSSLGSTRSVPNFFQAGHTHDGFNKPGSSLIFQYAQTRSSYEWVMNISARLLAFTAPAWSKNNSTPTARGADNIGEVYAERGLWIGPRAVRLRSVFNYAAITGNVVKGDVFFYDSPTLGSPIGAVCTTGGVIGTGAVMYEFGEALETGVKVLKMKEVVVPVVDGVAAGTISMPAGTYVMSYSAETPVTFPGAPAAVNLKLGSAVGGAQYVANTDVKAQDHYTLTTLYAGRKPATTIHYTVAQTGAADGTVVDGSLTIRILYR